MFYTVSSRNPKPLEVPMVPDTIEGVEAPAAEFKVIKAATVEELNARVREAAADRWKPSGPLAKAGELPIASFYYRVLSRKMAR
jgi:hypothetical protein